MTSRTFIFCDFCNPNAMRYVEQRRDSHRGNRTGRRVSDARAWHEGDSDELSLSHGWRIDDGVHVCPSCVKRQAEQHAAA